MKNRYKPIPTDEQAIEEMLQDVEHLTHMDQAHALDVPITLQELMHALNTGAKNRAPGCDGFCLEFYTTNWDTKKKQTSCSSSTKCSCNTAYL
jgi:hypothetical protein